MSWRIEEIETDQYGKIYSRFNRTDIIGDFTIEQTLGTEMLIQSGDVSLRHREPFTGRLTSGGTRRHYLLFYFNNNLIDAYRINRDFDEEDKKHIHRYSSRIKSIQQIFFEEIKNAVIWVNYDSWAWAKGLCDGNAHCIIKEIKITYETGVPGSAFNRIGFSLGDLLKSFHGSGYIIDNCVFFLVDQVSFPGKIMNENDLPILYRAESRDENYLEDAIEYTFGNYGVTWLDVFKLAIFAYNGFIRVTPKNLNVDGDDYLAMDIDIIPRVLNTPSPVAPKWLELKKQPEKAKLDGVHLISSIKDTSDEPSFEYQQGDINDEKVFEREIDIADPDATIQTWVDTLYWSAGDYDAIEEKYDILDGSSNNRPYFSEGFVEPYYAGMVGDGAGDGYSGLIRYAGERAGNHFNASNGDVIQINRLVIKKTGGGAKADVEGIVLT